MQIGQATLNDGAEKFVRIPRTGDDLALWRAQNGLSLKRAAKITALAYNTFRSYELRGMRNIPKQCSLAIAAIDAGLSI